VSEWANIGDEELHALIDGELDPFQRSRFAGIVANDPAAMRRVMAFRSDRELIRLVYAPLKERPLPTEWLRSIAEGTGPRRSLFHPPTIFAVAASVAFCAAGAIAWRQFPLSSKDDIVAEALAARENRVAPDLVIAIDDRTGRAVRDDVASAALGMRVKAPDLSRVGYRLATLLVYGHALGGQAVEFVYRGAKGRLATLYVRRSTSAPRFDQFARGGTRVCLWQDDVLGSVVAGEMPAPEMQRLASLAYTGLSS